MSSLTYVTQVSRADVAFVAGAVAASIPNSKAYLGFVVHITGAKVGSSVDVQGSLDGSNFATLLSGAAVIDATGQALFQIELFAPVRGGLKVAFDNAGGGAGVVNVSMCSNPHVISR